MARKKLLITGMSGLIGGAVRRQLEGRYELSALNRRKVEGVVCHRADIADLGAILPAFEGVDVVVHLAANLWGDWEELLQSNVIGIPHLSGNSKSCLDFVHNKANILSST